MGIRHQVSGAADAPVTWDMYGFDHLGIGELRSGSVVTSVLSPSTAVTVTFAMPFSDANYEVFIQAKSNAGVSAYPSDFLTTGFTLNLSAGVNATFSYFAVQSVSLTPAIVGVALES